MSSWDASSGKGLCDFCSPPLPAEWSYNCADFVMFKLVDGRDFVSRGEWGACAVCSELIERDMYDRLAKRILRHPAAKERTKAERVQIVREHREVLERFRKNRSGEREEWTPHVELHEPRLTMLPND